MKKKVKEAYSQVVKGASPCLPDSSCCTTDTSFYEQLLADLPSEMRKMSWGCGNPLAINVIQPGDVVADIGCGVGLDVLLAAKKVGSKGKAIGIDFTTEMLETARQNARKAKLLNTEFLYGEAEKLPLEDNSVSVVISNCVLNLVPDKKKAFEEIARVLKPGGKLVVSDIVSEKELPESLKRDPRLWSSCIGGAIPEEEYLSLVRQVGLRGLVIFSRQAIETCGQKLWSITLQAIKPDLEARYLLPTLVHLRRNGTHLFLSPELPAWFSTNGAGAEIVLACDGKTSIRSVARKPTSHKEDLSEESVVEFLSELHSRRIALTSRPNSGIYPGRQGTMSPQNLEELWLHTNNSCNSRCKHCLVSAGDDGQNQLSLEELTGIVAQGRSLGVKRFYLTGGEPFLRPDIFNLMESILVQDQLIILTNGTLLEKLKNKLSILPGHERLLFQVSLEGSNASVHDAIRGAGSFKAALSGIKTLIDIGLTPVIATTLTGLNADCLAETSRFLHGLGIKHHHILWLHNRGKAAHNQQLTVNPQKMIEIMRELQRVSDELGIIVDNHKAACARVAGVQGRKYDLCHAAHSTLAMGPDGKVYPCAAFVGDSGFACGSVRGQALAEIWEKSGCIDRIRRQSVIDQAQCRNCPLMFLCGGGCLSYKHFASGELTGPDLYCQVYRELFTDALWRLAAPSQKGKDSASGNNQPKIYAAMRPPFNLSGGEFDVAAFHCACVLTTKSNKNGCGC